MKRVIKRILLLKSGNQDREMGKIMSKNMPLISIIVPVYRVEKYLEQCLFSLVSQTYSNIEIVMVDDGSPDQCPDILDAWAEKDQRIRVIHSENGGQSYARNLGLKAAKGDYITFVDSDDWIEPEYVQILCETVEKLDVDIAVVYPRDFKGKKISPMPFFQNSLNDFYDLRTNQAVKYFMEYAVAVMGKLYNRHLWENIEFPEGRKAEEYAVQLNILKKVEKVGFCNMHLYNYRVRNDSDSHDIKPKYRVDNIQSISESLDICSESFPDEKEWAESWLAALLHEFYSVKQFGIQEKRQYADVLSYAISQIGGLDGAYKKMEHSLDRIIYVYNYYSDMLTSKEKKRLQVQYREMFLNGADRDRKGWKRIKYFIAYISLYLL